MLRTAGAGGQLLDTTTDDGPALAVRKSLAVMSEGLFGKLCQDSPEGAAALATEFAGLLPCLEKHLNKGADLVSSFVLQGITRCASAAAQGSIINTAFCQTCPLKDGSLDAETNKHISSASFLAGEA